MNRKYVNSFVEKGEGAIKTAADAAFFAKHMNDFRDLKAAQEVAARLYSQVMIHGMIFSVPRSAEEDRALDRALERVYQVWKRFD